MIPRPTSFCLPALAAACYCAASAGPLLVEEGQARAVIALPAEPTSAAVDAADELQHHILWMTGAKLGIVQPGGAPAPTTLFVGDTEAARQAGIGASELKPEAIG